MNRLKIAFLATDNREHYKDYDAPQPVFNPGVNALMVGWGACGGVEIHIVSCFQQPAPAPEKLADHVWFHALHVPKIGWMRTLYQGCVRAVRKKLWEIQPDIVHGYGTERDCAISAIFSGFPNVVSIQGIMSEQARLFKPHFGSYGWLAARLENFTLPRSGGVICNSRYTESLVKPRSRKTWVVYPALRPAFLEPAPSIPRPAMLLNSGIISPRKRQLELLDVAEALHRRGLKFEFHFIGRADACDYTTAFLERIKPMEQAGFARYLGCVPSEDLIRIFDSAAGMIHFSSEESFGLNVAEALARNLKFFGSRVGGIAEIAGGAPSAELFGLDDWEGLTAAIARWIEERCPRPDNASRFMRERYHPEAVARRHLEIYREVFNVCS